MKIRDKSSWLQLIFNVLQKTLTELDFPTYNNTIFHQNPMCGLFFLLLFDKPSWLQVVVWLGPRTPGAVSVVVVTVLRVCTQVNPSIVPLYFDFVPNS